MSEKFGYCKDMRKQEQQHTRSRNHYQRELHHSARNAKYSQSRHHAVETKIKVVDRVAVESYGSSPKGQQKLLLVVSAWLEQYSMNGRSRKTQF